MSNDYDSTDELDDYNGDYTLEEYDIGPTTQQEEQREVSSIDFRMDAPPPDMNRSMENRIRDGAEAGAPEGMQLTRTIGSRTDPTQHTGPKAVKADFEAAKQVLRNQRLMERVRRERTMQGAQRVDLSSLALQPPSQAQKKAMKNKGSDDDEDEEDEDDNDPAFEKYRAQRIQFVQNSLPRFGTHTRVSKSEFASLVKEVHELVYVVCHIYQNNLEACVRLNLSFESLAPQFPHVRFCRLRSNEAMSGFKAAGLPALLIYKGGQMVTQALRVTDVLPKPFNDIDVAKLLQAKGILSVPTGLTAGASQARLMSDVMKGLSEDEYEEHDAHNGNNGSSSGFNLLDGSSASSSSTSARGGGRIQKGGKFTSHRAAESGSDSD